MTQHLFGRLGRRAALGLWVVFSGIASGPCTAEVLATRDQSPFVAIYGLPEDQGAAVLSKDTSSVGLRLAFTSHYTEQAADNESLLIDGQTTRAGLRLARGLGRGAEAWLSLDFIAHSGGFVDGPINDYHDAFGFSDGGRSHAPDDRQRFVYARNGRSHVAVTDSPSGIGDLRVGAKQQLARWGNWQTAGAAQLKLPTGDADRLTGSGAADVAAWLAIANAHIANTGFQITAGAGALYTGRGDVLADRRQRQAGFGWLGAGYAVASGLVLQAQVDTHSALYEDTGLEALDDTAVRGIFGLNWQLLADTALSGGIVEDLNPGASPDVGLHFALRQGF